MLAPQRLVTLAIVEDRGGVVGAATALHLTPSAVSQQLRALEREAGVPLLDRSARQVRLTEAGRRLAHRGRRIAGEVALAGDELSTWTEQSGGRMVVAAFQTFICQVLAPLVSDGRAAAAGLTLRIVELEGRAALQDLHAGAVDIVMTEELLGDTEVPAPTDADSVTRLEIDDRYRIIVPAAWDVPAGDEDLRATLAARPWIGQGPGTAGFDMLADLQRRWGFEADVVHECTEYTSAVALVGAGAGATLAPHLALPLLHVDGTDAAGGDLVYGDVQVLQATPDIGTRRVRAMCRASRRPRLALDVLLGLLADQSSLIGLTARRVGER